MIEGSGASGLAVGDPKDLRGDDECEIVEFMWEFMFFSIDLCFGGVEGEGAAVELSGRGNRRLVMVEFDVARVEERVYGARGDSDVLAPILVLFASSEGCGFLE